MIRWALLLLLLAVPADAQMGGVPIYVVPPTVAGGCSHSLVFTVSCNSQYIPVILL